MLTAVTRLENLPAVAASIATASAGFAGERACEIDWHLRFDPHRRHVGGQVLKNEMLDEIRDGWVFVLDDDTVMHPDLLSKLIAMLSHYPQTQMIVVSQQRKDGTVLHVRRETMKVGQVDIGQAILRRSLIADIRIPDLYEGDGHFLGELSGRVRHALFVHEVLSYHNALGR